MTRYGVNVQPFYVLLNPADSLAAPLAPPVAYQPDAADFAQFLDAHSRCYGRRGLPHQPAIGC